MNNFEYFTVVIGGLAILFEAIKNVKEMVKGWFSTYKH